MVLHRIAKDLLGKKNVISIFCRYVHKDDYSKVLVPLKDRKLLKIYGSDSQEFLQGLVTNDMNHFHDGAHSMFAMFLNNKGRTLYDVLIHKWGENLDSFLIECDKAVFSPLQKHLKVYKLKRDVHFQDMNRNTRVWALLPIETDDLPEPINNITSPINIYRDPRLPSLGCRILTESGVTSKNMVDILSSNKNEIRLGDEDVYKYLRYKLGVGEGPTELPPGNCLPLEMNCDYLHGVSFHKGCYIGQELTARVHHTGVVRKRLMPLKFDEVVEDFIETDAVITKDVEGKGANVGKLKGIVHDYGLGLIRIKEALDAKNLKIAAYTAEAVKPTWWPAEAPKEKIDNKIM